MIETNKMTRHVTEILEKKLMYRKDENGMFEYEIYADYRDELDNKSAIEILNAKHPMERFYEKMDDCYFDSSHSLRDELKSDLQKYLEADDGSYPEGLTDEEYMLLEEVTGDLVYFSYPEKHYLNQDFYVNIMVDTGDGNYDYVLNSVYPSWYGKHKDPIDDKASILWLAKQQGYTKTQLKQALNDGDMADPKGFLESMRVEVANITSHMMTLTFLVKMTLQELMDLNELVKLQDRNGVNYDTRKNPYCGYILLNKKTETGLYDPWNGGGSVFEIQLDKDVRLPIRFIRSALPDGGDGYSISSVYGLCGSVWEKGKIKQIHAPKNIV